MSRSFRATAITLLGEASILKQTAKFSSSQIRLGGYLQTIMVNRSWQSGTSLGQNYRDGGVTRPTRHPAALTVAVPQTHRVYQGTTRNPVVTEIAPRASSPQRRNTSPYKRAPSPQGRYRHASPTPQRPAATRPAERVQHRSPSPQRRYQERRTADEARVLALW